MGESDKLLWAVIIIGGGSAWIIGRALDKANAYLRDISWQLAKQRGDADYWIDVGKS